MRTTALVAPLVGVVVGLLAACGTVPAGGGTPTGGSGAGGGLGAAWPPGLLRSSSNASPAADNGSGAPGAASPGTPAASAAAPAPFETDVTPAVTTSAQDGADGPVTVTANGAPLQDVTLTRGSTTVVGAFSADRRSWTSEPLAPGLTYGLAASTVLTTRGTGQVTRTFTTSAPRRSLTADVSPFGDATVGIGQPVVVNLSAAVKDPQGRAAVERALTVDTSQDVGPASWAWINDTRLDYRPKEFWPSGTTVTVHVNLAGVKAGDGLWGTKDRDVSFRIGRAFVMRIDNATHTMTVTQDGATVRTVPVSMGRTGFETRSGIKTIMSHDRSVRMTSASYGGADFYDEVVDYAQRLTWSGEYIHSAPWSVYAQGKRNVSHGCVNVSPTNAIWLFKQTLMGDPVITTGTKRQMEPGNGDGGDWQYAWDEWTSRSALSGSGDRL